jgi:hypothetical protein
MQVAHTRDWVDYLIAIGPVIGVIAVLIVGFVQASLQQSQSKQGLFDRRFKVYSAAEAYLLKVLQTDGKTDIPAYQEFRKDTDPAEFLFGPDVWKFVGDIGRLGLELRSKHTVLDHNTQIVKNVRDASGVMADVFTYYDETEYREACIRVPALVGEIGGLMKQVADAISSGTKDAFRPYLQLRHDLPWYVRLERYMDDFLQRLDRTLSRSSERV